jgi:hypothetical protein
MQHGAVLLPSGPNSIGSDVWNRNRWRQATACVIALETHNISSSTYAALCKYPTTPHIARSLGSQLSTSAIPIS